MRPYYVFDRWGKQVDAIAWPIEARHKDPITGGTDTLTLTVAGSPLDKGQRIVWRDKFGAWHEHEVSDYDTQHAEGQYFQTATCTNSISELLLTFIRDIRPSGATSTTALERVLEGTRWKVGTVQPTGTKDFSFYHVSSYEAITEIVDAFGAELETTIVPREDTVVERRVDILNHRGDDYGHLFTYGRNLTGIHRLVDATSVYTALYGYGKGSQTYDPETGEATGGHSRKLTFADVNGGQEWVGDEDARLRYGIPDGKGGVKHSEGVVEFSDCEDPDELLQLTRDALKTASKPLVSYEGDVINFGEAGFTNGEDSRTGDTIYIRDKVLDERLQGRVLEMDRDLLDESNTKITLGNIRSTYTQKLAKDLADLAWLKDQSSKWNDIVVLPDAYLDAVVNRLNVLFNTTGGYVYYEKGEGLITYDRPVDQNPTMAIQITGAGFRIANSKNSDGSWNWRTFGTGDGFTADEIITGIIKGGSNWWNLATGDLRFEQGSIASTDGKNFWNLSTGDLLLTEGVIHDAAGYNSWDLGKSELKISAQTQVGNLALGDYVANESKTAAEQLFDDRMTQEEIFNTLTGGGSTQGIYLQNGRVYINSTYIGTGILSAGKIQDRNGDNYWDLETGDLKLSSGVEIAVGRETYTLGGYVSSQASSAANTAIQNSLTDYVDKTTLMRDYLTQQKVFNYLTNNGACQGLYMSGGQLYINASYVRTGILESQNGASVWNLNTGFFETSTQVQTSQFHTLYSRVAAGTFSSIMDVTTIGQIAIGTSNSDPNVHDWTIRSFSNLVLGASAGLCPSYSPPGNSYTYYTGLYDFTMNFIAGMDSEGLNSNKAFKLTWYKWQAHMRHGIMVSNVDNGSSWFTWGTTS